MSNISELKKDLLELGHYLELIESNWSSNYRDDAYKAIKILHKIEDQVNAIETPKESVLVNRKLLRSALGHSNCYCDDCREISQQYYELPPQGEADSSHIRYSSPSESEIETELRNRLMTLKTWRERDGVTKITDDEIEGYTLGFQECVDWLKSTQSEAIPNSKSLSHTSSKESEVLEKIKVLAKEGQTIAGRIRRKLEPTEPPYNGDSYEVDLRFHRIEMLVQDARTDSNLQTETESVKGPKSDGCSLYKSIECENMFFIEHLEKRIAELGMEVNRLTFELELSRESHVKRIAQLEAENAKLREALKESEG